MVSMLKDGLLPTNFSLFMPSKNNKKSKKILIRFFRSKEKIEQFMRGHFYGHLDFDLDNTVYMFTAGRYEYRNKGTDLFVEALARLNKKLMDEQSDVTVAAFMIFNGKTNSFNVESLTGKII